jgi:hypothetical protein
MDYFLNHGILMGRAGVGALSTVIGEPEIEIFVEALKGGLQAMRKEGRTEFASGFAL